MTTPIFPSVIGHNLLDGGTDAQDGNNYPGPLLQEYAAAVVGAGHRKRLASVIVAIGDSWIARYRKNNGYSQGVSFLWWAKTLLPDVDVNIIDAGVSGNTTAQMLSRFAEEVVPQSPSAVLIAGGINDNVQGVPPETTISNIQKMIEMTWSISAVAIVATIPLTTSHAATVSNVGARNKVNDYIRALNGWGVIVLDENQMLSAASMSAMPGANSPGALVADNLHPSAWSAHRIGAPLSKMLRKIFTKPRLARLAQSSGRNFLTNGDMAGNNASGAQGFSLGAGFTGTGPDRWAVTRSGSTIAAVCSKEVGTDGVDKFRFAMSAGGSNAEYIQVQNQLNLRLWASGGPTSSGRIFYVPETGLYYAPVIIGTLGATDNTASWPTQIGATVVDGTATLMCIGRITKGGRADYGMRFRLNSLTAGQVCPFLRMEIRNTAGTSIMNHYSGLLDASSGLLPTLPAGADLTMSENTVVPTAFDPENITSSSGPIILITCYVVCNNGGQADFYLSESQLIFTNNET